jgi:NodT family efflux transporter outer membrane factor (OMF) lipoprotein
MRRPPVALLWGLMLTACTAGPNYRIPDRAMVKSPSANAPFHGGVGAGFEQAELPAHWWQLYDNSRLNAYVAEALAANADLRAADANLRRAGEVVLEVRAARTVQTRVDAGFLGSYVGGYTLAVPINAPWISTAGVTVSYPLDLAGGIRRGIEAASAESEAVQAARDQVRVIVAAMVTRGYAAVCSANVTLDATRRVLEIQKKTLASVQRMFDGGRGTSFDVTRAQGEVDKSMAAIPDLLAARQASLYELATLMGRAPAEYPRDMQDCDTAPTLREPLPTGDGAALLKRRPDIRAAERRLAAATADIGVETAQLYPQVSLVGSAGAAEAVSSFLTTASLGGYAGPLVSWVFPNRRAIHAQIAAAGDAAEVASAEFDNTVLEALRQTETSLSSYTREMEHDRALEASRDDAARASDQATRLFQFGRVGFLEVLTSQSSLAAAETALAQSRGALIDRQIAVFMALGGGWEP